VSNVNSILGLEEIYKNYDIFILDQWGVMHNGYKGFLNAIECVNILHKNNKSQIIISNSSKRNFVTRDRLSSLGFNPDFFTEIMTSGEMIWQSLFNNNYDQIKNLGKNCFYIYDETKENGNTYIKGLEKFNFINNIEKADFILGCTPFLKKRVIDYLPLLEIAKKKNLPFICANPDFDTIENDSKKLLFCMGTIAELYKNIGGETFYLGKPSYEIYSESIKKIPNFNKSKILAIGDSIYHDIKGAVNFGIDSLLITTTGIHKELFDKKKPIWSSPANKLQKNDIFPTFICSEFKF
jgi:HAD superfamily hydrolase (TIGR01459 family)